MNDTQQTNTFILRLYLATVDEPVFVSLRKEEKDRFTSTLLQFGEGVETEGFFVSDTVNGKTIAINLSNIQAVNILWEPATSEKDQPLNDGPITIYLKNRKEPMESYTDSPDELHEFFSSLDLGPEVSGFFAGFLDSEGEELLFNTKELLYMEAPTCVVDEGWEMIKAESGMDD